MLLATLNHRLDEDDWSWYWDVHAYAYKVKADEKTSPSHASRSVDGKHLA